MIKLEHGSAELKDRTARRPRIRMTGDEMLVSLGHSCQTRFILDDLDAPGRRMPFDFNIATRQALVAALATDGASLAHDEGTATVFRMASDGREGVEASGLYFWHDYPLAEDRLSLADGWQREFGRVNEKYAALWTRLAALLRSDDEKALVLSNSQHNLGQFAGSETDFHHRFGLGAEAFSDISTALDAFGAKNYRLLFLTRSAAEFAETAMLDDPRLDHRLVGTLSLRPDRRVAASIAPGSAETHVAALCGTYDGGAWEVRAHSAGVAGIHRRGDDGLRPHGSITLAGTGAVAWIEGRDRFRDITHGEGEIRFSDGERWRRD